MHKHRISGTISLKVKIDLSTARRKIQCLPITMNENTFEYKIHKTFDFILVSFKLKQQQQQ